MGKRISKERRKRAETDLLKEMNKMQDAGGPDKYLRAEDIRPDKAMDEVKRLRKIINEIFPPQSQGCENNVCPPLKGQRTMTIRMNPTTVMGLVVVQRHHYGEVPGLSLKLRRGKMKMVMSPTPVRGLAVVH